MFRIFCFLILLSSCSINSGGQKALHIESKGVTCDALNYNVDKVVLCGESSKYVNQNGTASHKDGFVVFGKIDSDKFDGYTIGNNKDDSRVLKVFNSSNNFVFSGYGLEGKKAFLAGTDDHMKVQWSWSCDSLEAFEEPAGAQDKLGNIFVVNKNPAATPYYGYFTLLDKEGIVKWTKKMDQIDVMSDIIACKSGDFLIHFKQKGAYIDGGTRKKYFIVPSIRISTEGKITNQYKFLVDREKYMDLNIHKVLESSTGNFYYLGSAWTVFNRTDLLIIKSDQIGRVIWSYSYQTNAELAIKSAAFDSKGNVVVAADSYGHSGGMMRGTINTDGDFLWNSFNTTTPYEQIKNFSIVKDNYYTFYDKTLNFGIMTANLEGKSCMGKTSVLEIKRSNAEVMLSSNNAVFDSTQVEWKKCELTTKSVGRLDAIIDCGK
ncbi:MAG: hypothetical protein ABI851_13920 [Saprospiraceae bacterium]